VLRAWIQASRPLAQANIAVPLIFGQALAYGTTGRFDWTMAVVIHVVGILDQLFIVYSNDVADAEADAGNESPTPFSGGSRVLVEGKLSRNALGFAALVVGIAMVVIAVVAALDWNRRHAPVFIALGFFLMWAYSFPPLRLSYRGEGEVLQGLGVGIVLPVFAYYMQAGDLLSLPATALGATFLLGYGGNVTTALPDFVADERANKRTLVVRLGELPARWVSLALLATACFFPFDTGPRLATTVATIVAAPPLVLLLANIPAIGRANARDRSAVIRFVLLNGAAINLLLVAWSIAIVEGTPG
jgi:1,4-dihydroxy-2-naphthoate octaprenyltransferase